MSIYGPTSESESTAVPDLSDYAKKEYADARDGLRVLKTGDTIKGILRVDSSREPGRDVIVAKTRQANINVESRGVSIKTGNLALGIDAGGPDIDVLQKAVIPEGGIRIRNVSNTQHFQLGWNSSGNLELQHTEGANQTTVFEITPGSRITLLTKARDVNSRKPIITVWAEENDSINDNAYEWSFGNGSAGGSHRTCGYTMMTPGRVIRMGLVISGNSTEPGDATVNIVVNGVEMTAYGITKAVNLNSGTAVFETPLELNRGDVVNFRSASTNSSVSSATVALLIELDM